MGRTTKGQRFFAHMRRGNTFIRGSRLSRRIQSASNAGALKVRHVRASDARVRFPEVRSRLSSLSGDSSKWRINSSIRERISDTRRARWMDAAGAFEGLLGSRRCRMNSRGLLVFGTRSGLCHSVSEGCGRGMGYCAHAVLQVVRAGWRAAARWRDHFPSFVVGRHGACRKPSFKASACTSLRAMVIASRRSHVHSNRRPCLGHNYIQVPFPLSICMA